MATDLTAHQTRGAAPIRWIYDPDKADERKAFKRSLGGGGGSSARPSWIDSPPEGYVVASSDSGLLRSTARTMAADRLRQLGAASGSQYWTDPDTGQTFAMGKKRPQEPAVEADPPLLDDYVPPTLDPVDLDLDLGEEEDAERHRLMMEEKWAKEDEESGHVSDWRPGVEEELTIEPAVREPAPDYALGEAARADMVPFKSAEELARMSEAERVQYRKDRLRSVGAGDRLQDAPTGFTDEALAGGSALPEEEEEGALSLEEQIVETTAVNPMEQFRDIYGFGFEGATAPRFPVGPDISIARKPAPDATYLQRRAAESGGYATPEDPQTFPDEEEAVDISAAGGVPALMNEEDRERRFAEIADREGRLSGAPQFYQGPDIDITGSEDMAELPEDAGPGLLDRLAGMGGKIGQLVRENPDLVLQGLRTIGELGGEYKRGRREQEAADRMAEEARMGTAISALTRGRVSPTVTPRMPRTSAGEGMFDVLAGIGRGGQEFMGQKRALEKRERLEGMQDEEIARTRRLEDEAIEREIEATVYQKEQDLRAQGLEEEAIQREVDRFEQELMLRAYEAKTGRMEAVAKGLPDGADTGDLDPTQLAQIDQVLTRLEEHVEDPKYGTTLGMSGLGPPGAGLSEIAKEWLPGAQELDFVKNPEYFRAQTADIVFRVLKPLSKEGRLSQTDYDNLERMVGRPDMSPELVKDLLADIRESIEKVQKNAPGTHEKWSDGGEGGASQSSANEEDLLALADRAYDDEGNIVDREAYAELQRLDSKTP